MKAHESKEKQEQFVELRAIKGMSFDLISKELEISKSTAISWGKDFHEAIDTMKSAHISMLVDTYELGLIERVKEHRELSERLRTEIAERDLSGVHTDRLLILYLESSKRVELLLEKHNLEKIRISEIKKEGSKGGDLISKMLEEISNSNRLKEESLNLARNYSKLEANESAP